MCRQIKEDLFDVRNVVVCNLPIMVIHLMKIIECINVLESSMLICLIYIHKFVEQHGNG